MDSDLQTIINSRTKDPAPGKWCKNFKLTKEEASNKGIPAIFVASKDGCHNCQKMEESFLNDTYKSWMANSPYLYYFVHIGESSYIQNRGFFDTNVNIMPKARIYWYADGKKKVDTYVSYKTLVKSSTEIMNFFKKKLEVEDYKPPQPEPAKCSVAFNPNGGTLTSGMNKIVIKDTAVGELPIPARSGWTFVGWFTTTDGGTRLNATTTIAADSTYYAHWTELPIQPDQPAPDTPQPPPVPGKPLETMFGLCRDCTIITKDNKVLQYSAAAQKISVIGDYNPTAFLSAYQ